MVDRFQEAILDDPPVISSRVVLVSGELSMSSAPLSNKPATTSPTAPAAKVKYVKAIGPRLRIVLYVVFALVALLAANSAYLGSITALEYFGGQGKQTFKDLFYVYMIALHIALGLLLIGPYLVFGVIHLLNTRNRKNRRAVMIGYALFFVGIAVLLTGLALVRLPRILELKNAFARSAVYWGHVVCPLAAVWLYWLHRLAGPKIRWTVGLGWGAAIVAVCGLMVVARSQDPRKWSQPAPAEGAKYFFPSLAGTANGNFVSAKVMMADNYCRRCHEDAYNDWFHSAHRLSSFNNPAYLAAVRETREVALKRDDNVQASRWCAGCHDPVPFFSGAFDDPKFDVVNHPTSQAGITCTTCHSITHVNSTKGNADYVIEEPLHYPFAFSENRVLQFVNEQLVKAKPEFHKTTFLKPLHKSAEFCSTCHKVHLPKALNHYKEFLRGQNHYDSYLLSGVSGHGARSFYYPPKAIANCAGCHMPFKNSNDFGAKVFADNAKKEEMGNTIHNHLFPAANTAVGWFNASDETVEAHRKFLKDTTRVDIFGIKENGALDGKLHAPLRPTVPTLEPGKSYLIETVVRTLKLGHPLTQGTVDSNELWLDVVIKSGDKILGRSGGIDEEGEVDRWAHYFNVFMLDRNGNRINRRNPQDIFTPLYNHQIPPGAADTMHYSFKVPEGHSEPITIEASLKYRKFDKEFVDFFIRNAKEGDNPIRQYKRGEEDKYGNPIPITIMAQDTVTLPVAGGPESEEQKAPEIPVWQRWNDYGIGLLIEGLAESKAELRQAIQVFGEVEKLNRFDGPLNMARALQREGRLDEASAAIERAMAYTEENNTAPPWTVAWLNGVLLRQQGKLDDSIESFKNVVDPSRRTDAMIKRGFDFSLDVVVVNELGTTLFERAKTMRGQDNLAERKKLLEEAVAWFKKSLEVDSEDVTAHYNLGLIYAQLDNKEKAEEHRKLHALYKPDENAQDSAVAAARLKYPHADHSAQSPVIYDLQRSDAPGLKPVPKGPSAQADDPSDDENKKVSQTEAPADRQSAATQPTGDVAAAD